MKQSTTDHSFKKTFDEAGRTTEKWPPAKRSYELNLALDCAAQGGQKPSAPRPPKKK